jgi:hypothetical protein
MHRQYAARKAGVAFEIPELRSASLHLLGVIHVAPLRGFLVEN